VPDEDEPTPGLDQGDAPERTSLSSKLTSAFSSGSSSGGDAEVRDRMRTLDPLERKWGLGGAAITLVLAAIFIPSLLHNTTQTLTTSPTKSGRCPVGYQLVGHVCESHVVHHPSEYVLRFTLLAVLGLLLLASVWFSKRTLTVFISFLTGLAAGTVGLLLIFYGGWLLVRSWRLQRYGATDAATVRKVAGERAAAKREAKKTGTATAAVATPSAKAAPTPSKRYTPKSKPRRR